MSLWVLVKKKTSYIIPISTWIYLDLLAFILVKLHSGLKNTTGIPQLYYGGQYLDVCRQSLTDDEDNIFCQQILQSPSAQAILLPSGTYTYYASNDKAEINTTCFRSRGLVNECIRSVSYCYGYGFQAVHCYDGERPNGKS